MLKSKLLQAAKPDANSGPVGIGVVDLGYWGPNLLQRLGDHPEVKVRWMCYLDRERLTNGGREVSLKPGDIGSQLVEIGQSDDRVALAAG